MPFDVELQQRIGNLLLRLPPETTNEFTEKKMFGGLAFLYKGKMTVGILKDDLMVRVVPEKMETVMEMDGVRPMAFTGKPMKEFVFVSPYGYESREMLLYWVTLGLEHAQLKLGEHP